MTDGPWIPTRGGTRRKLHVDRSCTLLERVDTTVREATEREGERYETCQHCGGEIDRHGAPGPRLSAKLSAMSVEEFDAKVAEVRSR